MDYEKLGADLMKAMYRLRRMRDSHISGQGDCKNGHLKPRDFMMLKSIIKVNDGDWVTMSQIAERFRFTPAAASQLIRRYEKAGFIERAIRDDNRRNVYVRVNDSGKAAIEAVKQEILHGSQKTIDALGEHDVKELIRIINKLSDYMEKEAQEGERL